MSMTVERAKSELMQIYGALSPSKQQAIDTLVKIEPCEDAISRDAALEKMADYVASGYADSAEDFEEYSRIICQLPSVTQKSGKWIKVKSGDKDFPESIVCSRCNNENSHLDFNENAEPIGKVFVTSKYCPNCGADMSEVEE